MLGDGPRIASDGVVVRMLAAWRGYCINRLPRGCTWRGGVSRSGAGPDRALRRNLRT
jgi:hypothetical protein